MKSRMDDKGVITLSPETDVEAYALKLWTKEYAGLPPNLIVETSLPKYNYGQSLSVGIESAVTFAPGGTFLRNARSYMRKAVKKKAKRKKK